jgi:UDP-N-acetylglucosamine--N-acetylmuramyl-(pentapeptide) pyrophosphoryl-undecaprenol N-acetylglucosamine transferase
MTVSELQATRTPAVIVPLPAGRGYQALNASDLVASGGAVVAEQDSVEAVARRVRDVITDPTALARMADPENGTDHRAAAAIMADAVMEYADA